MHMKVDVYNQKNEVVGTENLSEAYFGVPWKPGIVAQVLRALQANKRSPWAHAKGRGEVRGGGRKPWRQKGTGRARHGSIRSPLWRKGGKSHGPQSERDYTQKINKKMRQIALFSVLSKKVSDKELKVVDTLHPEVSKTKAVYVMATTLGAGGRTKKLDVLFVREGKDTALLRAARNIPKTKVVSSANLNVYDLMNHKHVFLDQRAIPEIVSHYHAK